MKWILLVPLIMLLCLTILIVCCLLRVNSINRKLEDSEQEDYLSEYRED